MSEPTPTIEQRIAAAMAPEPAPEAPAAVVEEAAPAADEAPVEAAPEAEAPEAEAPQDLETKTYEIGNLADLAAALDVDVAQLYNLRIPVSDGDQRLEVPLGEWKDAFVARERSQARERELAHAREQLEAEATRAREHFQQRVSIADAMLQEAEKQLLGEYQQQNWADLRANDPAEYAVRRADYQDRMAALQSTRSKVAQEIQAQQEQMREQQQAQMREVLSKEHQALLRAIPDWQDEEKARTGKQELRTYLLAQGFNQNEVEGLADHRAVVITRKAMMYDREVARANAAKKKVTVAAQRLLKPGAPQARAAVQAEQEGAMKARLRKSGDTKDAAAIIKQRLFGSR